jgi:ABC-type transport system substrate-binding protein
MVMVPNPDYWDRSSVHLDRVTISMGLPTDAEIGSGYRSGELDVARVGDPAAFAKSPDLAQAITHVDKEYSVNFLTLIPSKNPVLRDVRVRKAIALAIDRNAVGKASPSVAGASSLVPSTLPGFDASVGVRSNVAAARGLLAAAGYPGGKGFPTLSVMTTHDDVLIRAVLRGLRRNLGIRAVQDIEDLTVYSAKRQEVQPPSFVGFFTTGYTSILTWRAWVSGTYPPSQTELLSLAPPDYTHYQVLQATGTAKSLAAATRFLHSHASRESLLFESFSARADATANAARATALYKRAAAVRQSTFEFIPFAYRDLDYLIRPGIKGVHVWTGYFTISFKGVSVS